MSHYFTNDFVSDQEYQIHFEMRNKAFTLASHAGVFSKDKLDTGTRILLETVLDHEIEIHDCLDLGCGIGPVGVVLSSFYDCKMTMIDVNQQAVKLAKQNMASIGKEAEILCQDGVHEGDFDCVLLNPPIRAGKQVIYRLFDQVLDHLMDDGRFWIVMRKDHGVKSAISYIEDKGFVTERVSRDKGFWIVRIKKASDD